MVRGNEEKPKPIYKFEPVRTGGRRGWMV